jgi:hypothetical protein
MDLDRVERPTCQHICRRGPGRLADAGTRNTRAHIDGAGSRGPCPPHPSETKITSPTGQQGRQSRRDGVQPAADPRPLDGEGSECSLCSDERRPMTRSLPHKFWPATGDTTSHPQLLF